MPTFAAFGSVNPGGFGMEDAFFGLGFGVDCRFRTH